MKSDICKKKISRESVLIIFEHRLKTQSNWTKKNIWIYLDYSEYVHSDRQTYDSREVVERHISNVVDT